MKTLYFCLYSQGHNNRLEIAGLLKFTITVTSSLYPGGKFRQVITTVFTAVVRTTQHLVIRTGRIF